MRDITQQNQHHYKNFQQTTAKAKRYGMKANRDLLPQQQQQQQQQHQQQKQ